MVRWEQITQGFLYPHEEFGLDLMKKGRGMVRFGVRIDINRNLRKKECILVKNRVSRQNKKCCKGWIQQAKVKRPSNCLRNWFRHIKAMNPSH